MVVETAVPSRIAGTTVPTMMPGVKVSIQCLHSEEEDSVATI